MLKTAAEAMEENLADLNRLDSAIGDGDHGTAILAAMRAASNSSLKAGTLAQTLETIGWDIMGATSGSTSALNGAFYTGMGAALAEKNWGEELDADRVITLFESGLAHLRTATKAQPGDKTLLDALVPAIEAMRALRGRETTFPELFSSAAQAARVGAESTKDLVAKQGRAKNLGERGRGHLDAGAVSTALIYAAFEKAVQP